MADNQAALRAHFKLKTEMGSETYFIGPEPHFTLQPVPEMILGDLQKNIEIS
jgi:hypothetical protein